jgi:hypothetical protein
MFMRSGRKGIDVCVLVSGCRRTSLWHGDEDYKIVDGMHEVPGKGGGKFQLGWRCCCLVAAILHADKGPLSVEAASIS